MKEIKTRRDLMEALSKGYTVEVMHGERWNAIKTFKFDVTNLEKELLREYRIKPTTKPSIDWEHVHPRYNYLAIDKNGVGYLYAKEPYKLTQQWTSDNGDVCGTQTHSSLTIGTCHWEDSLIKRPTE